MEPDLLMIFSRLFQPIIFANMICFFTMNCWCIQSLPAQTQAGAISSVSSGKNGCDTLGNLLTQNNSGSFGTLLRWNSGRYSSGGPDLNAPLVTDRPDFTEASSTVGRKVTQLEIGYTYTKNNGDVADEKSHSYPEVLIRHGILADWLELRFAWNYSDLEMGPVQTSGAEDLYLGLKIALTPQDQFLPEMAIIPQMTVPSGDDALSSGETLPGLNWIYGWELNDYLSTAGSTQFNRAVDGGAVHTEWAQSWTIATSLTEKIGGYAEWFGIFPDDALTAQTEHYFNGGFTYLVNNDLQWDIRAGVGLNDNSDDYFIGTGLSMRFR